MMTASLGSSANCEPVSAVLSALKTRNLVSWGKLNTTLSNTDLTNSLSDRLALNIQDPYVIKLAANQEASGYGGEVRQLIVIKLTT